MSTVLALLVIFGIGAVYYAIKRMVYRGVDSVADSIRNKRIDKQRAAGTATTTENLADRYR